eukprot:Seg231.4 transcript_id=Seg231.4/GoldUCD/mRNA.D3Y31 product="hypothetical protein" pseudo=true protein_id=Seg231.4/GoldUCD/D3Y31
MGTESQFSELIVFKEKIEYQHEKDEREQYEKERISELEMIITEKEELVEKVRQRAQQEISELNDLLEDNKR